MVMMPNLGPAARRCAPANAAGAKPTLIVPSPAGTLFNQRMAYELAESTWSWPSRLVGIDERVIGSAATCNVIPVPLEITCSMGEKVTW